ncbi:MAG: hypothetical protein Q9168_006756 [Polycauliona sp. 1 TL-2023]
MPPFINLPAPYPVETNTNVKGLLNNPTVTHSEKVFYVTGIIFTFLCLLLDIGMLAYIGVKVYRLCRCRRAGLIHGVGVVGGHEEKGLLVDGNDEKGTEQPPAYRDDFDEGTDKGYLLPFASSEKELAPMALSYCRTLTDPYEQAIGYLSKWHDTDDETFGLPALPHLDEFDPVAFLHGKMDTNNKELQPTNEEVTANKVVVSPTSKAAHLSPHDNCLACRKLAQSNFITSTNKHGNEESVTFPLTWDDMHHHGELIKWFLNNNPIKAFIHEPEQHYTFTADYNRGNPEGVPTPTSKLAHLNLHRDCKYCRNLAQANGLSGMGASVTFPLTMDDMLEYKDLINSYLDMSGAFEQSPAGPAGNWVEKIQFDDDVRLQKDSVEA